MERAASLLGSRRRSNDAPPISVVEPQADREGEINSMPPRRGQEVDDEFLMREALSTLMLQHTSLMKTTERIVETQAAQPKANGKMQNVMMSVIAILALAGSAGQFIGSSGIFIGKDQSAKETIQRDLNSERDARLELQRRFDNLRTLYLMRFGEDPDKVDLETARRTPKGK